MPMLRASGLIGCDTGVSLREMAVLHASRTALHGDVASHTDRGQNQ
jgi:hypothetical protein